MIPTILDRGEPATDPTYERSPRPRRTGLSSGTAGGTAGRTSRPWDTLTPAEFRVAVLVIEGLTSRKIGEALFVSRRTVESHLAHVYRKLGLCSRTQLAVEMARRIDAEYP
jgi:DNA-binding CsgD family transcriptional regulator